MTSTPTRTRPNGIRDRIPALLRERNFRRYWTAQSISYMGDQVSTIAIPLIGVVVLDASPAEMGLLGAAPTLPNLLLSIHAGAWVDRRGRRRVTMAVTDVVRALLLLAVPVAWATGTLSLELLYTVAFLTGAMAVVFGVAAQGLFTSLVPRERFVEGMSLKQGSFSFSWVAGPGVGGALVQVVGAPLALVLDALSFLGSALLLRGVRAEEPPGAERTRGQVREGLLFVARTPVLLAKFVAGSLLNFFYTVYFTLMLLFASRELGLSPTMIGLALGGGAVGALAGSVIANRTSRRFGIGTTFVVGSVLFPAALVLVPVAHGSPWVGFALVTVAELVSGAGLMLSDISGNSIQQAITPDRYRARVQGAYMALSFGARPLGALVAGGMGTVFGLRTTLLVAAVGGVLSIIPVLPSAILRMRELPDEK